jgi:hypothetical protein
MKKAMRKLGGVSIVVGRGKRRERGGVEGEERAMVQPS